MPLVAVLLALVVFAPVQKRKKGDGPELTSGRPIPKEQACYDVLRYELSVRVDPERRSIKGVVDMQAKLLSATDDILLDLDDRLKVEGVGLVVGTEPAYRKLESTHRGGEIRVSGLGRQVPVGSDFVLRTEYEGKPREAPMAPWDGGFVWSKTKSGAQWIATANQMQGADLWWPCKDQPDDEPNGMSIRVSVPSPLVVASNGRLEGVDEDFDCTSENVEAKRHPGWRTFRWKVTTPINAYGVALNIAPYETITRDYTSVAGDTFPVTYWVLPENLEKGRVLFEDILRQMAYFESVFGPYPFRGDKYGVAETPHLGMEHQSIIAYGNDYRGDLWGEDRGYDELHLHEFAHEWWANLVTCANWNDFWIHESFASYAQALYAEHVGGEKSYFTEMHEQLHHANLAPIAPREPRSTSEMYFGDREGSPGGDIYAKGAWVLHTLRWLLGDEQFFPALRLMAYPDPALEKATDGSACRFATTEEIRGIAEKSSGQDLTWFFDVYLRQPRLPRLDWKVKGGRLHLEWTSPTGRPFPMPVEVELGGEFVRVPCPDGKGQLDLGGKKDVAVDPRDRMLREGNGQGR